MKNIRSKYFLLILITIPFLTVITGLVDVDYFWQTEFGKYELLNHQFYELEKISHWGSLDLDSYIDHEWLSNVIFYLLSLCPFSIIFTKLVICCLIGFCIYYFSKYFCKVDTISLFSLVLFFFFCLCVVNIKSYIFSVMCFIIELVLLKTYGDFSYKKSLILSCLVVVIWNNTHSGSIPVYFILAFIYFITEVRRFDKKFLMIGVVDVLSLLINPYGVDLLLFNMRHMKTLSNLPLAEWDSIDLSNINGFIAVIAVLLILLNFSRIEDNYIKYISLVCCILCFDASRHIVYLLPCTLYLIEIGVDVRFLKLNLKYTCLVLFILFGIVLSCKLISYNENLSKLSDDIITVVLDDCNGDSIGLYTDYALNHTEVNSIGLKSFDTGLLPSCGIRWQADYLISVGCSDYYVTSIIKYYNLNKFLFKKYGNNGGLSNLYTYFMNKSEYRVLYDNDEYCYIVK